MQPRNKKRQLAYFRPTVEALESRICLSGFYRFEVVAQTGAGTENLTSIGKGVSINDNGYVAFKGESSNDDGLNADNIYAVAPGTTSPKALMNRVFMYPNALANTSLTPGTGSIFEQVQINNQNEVLARRRLNASVQVGFPFGSILTAPLTYLETWNANASNPPGLPSQQIVMGLPASASAPLWFFLNPVTGGTLPTALDLSSPFDGVFNYSSINNSGQVAVAALTNNQNGSANNLVTARHADGFPYLGIGTPGYQAQPMIADNGTIVLRNGDASKSIFTLNFNLGDIQEVASSTSGFTSIGLPGISDDGSVIAFAANEGTDTDGDGVTGPGVFAIVKVGTARKTIRVAKTDDGFSAFDLDQRISATSFNREQRASFVLFSATDSNGKKGIFQNQLKFTIDDSTATVTKVSPSKASPVLLSGDSVDGLGAIDDVAIHDSLNNKGQAAIWVQSGGTQAVLKTILPSQRIVLAWGSPVPVLIYEVITASESDIFVTAGSMPAYSTNKAYQDAVRDRVQRQFFDSGITKVQVVNGPPEEGATVVYFTDPCCGLYGIAYSGIDQFNRDSSGSVAVMAEGNLEIDAETVTHEGGHSLGLRHIDPAGAIEVMDYDAISGDIELFSNYAENIKEEPREGGTVYATTHNPVYHLRRYVEGATDLDLRNSGSTPGTWDLATATPGLLSVQFGFLLRDGGDKTSTMLYQVMIQNGYGESDGFTSLRYFESISLHDLEQLTFSVPDGSAIRVVAASTNNGAHDVTIAYGDPSVRTNVVLNLRRPTDALMLQKSDASFSTYSTIGDVQMTVIGLRPSFQNAVNPYDTDFNFGITPRDALLVINELNNPTIRESDGKLPYERATSELPFFDVNGDGYVTSVDGLMVINLLNFGSGEGETMPVGEVLEQDLQAVAVSFWSVTGPNYYAQGSVEVNHAEAESWPDESDVRHAVTLKQETVLQTPGSEVGKLKNVTPGIDQVFDDPSSLDEILGI